MPRDYSAGSANACNGCAEATPLEGGWSKADFIALEKRWAFLARLGEHEAGAAVKS